jgi:hypothetical protein
MADEREDIWKKNQQVRDDGRELRREVETGDSEQLHREQE